MKSTSSKNIHVNAADVDEINRAPPKTQAALLEAMQERQVTVEVVSYPLSKHFLVIATMNPVEVGGTFLLSKAQVDRFLAKVELGYPTLSKTVEILSRYESISSLDALKPVLTREDVLNLISLTKKVYVEQNVLKYIAAIVEATREHHYVKLGASPRGCN
jgi:MoxR-like ATPase